VAQPSARSIAEAARRFMFFRAGNRGVTPRQRACRFRPVPDVAQLFRHVTADLGERYRAILGVFAAAKRQFRLHLRPDEVRAEAQWPHGEVPSIEGVQAALSQLADWGNLIAQPDTSRVSTLEDFYRARFVYRLSAEGEAVEAGMAAFEEALARRAELQSVALEDIEARLEALYRLSKEGRWM
jgi:uncharacterized protein (TIGR02677 family)